MLFVLNWGRGCCRCCGGGGGGGGGGGCAEGGENGVSCWLRIVAAVAFVAVLVGVGEGGSVEGDTKPKVVKRGYSVGFCNF